MVLYGHTHFPVLKEEEGVFIMNPGALKDGRYGVITIENGKIKGTLKRI
jgi:predicted phosphodiesterase